MMSTGAGLLMLIMLVANPNGGQDTFVVDYDLTLTDCGERLRDFDIHDNSNIEFHCELQR